jgi:drug/metabolite transporter (DMT)-like permease
MSAYLGALAAFTASITWAFASTRYSAIAQTEGAVRVGIARASTASAIWLTCCAATDGLSSLAAIDLRHALILLGSIVCSYAVGDRVFFAASARIGVPSALAIATIYPLWAALFGTLARGEPLGVRRCVGIACCLTGVSAVLWMSRARAQRPEQARALWVGAGLALATSLFWAGNAVFLKQGLDGLSLYQANAFRYTLGIFLLLAQLRPTREPVQRLGAVALMRALWLPLVVDAGLGAASFVYGIAHTDLALGATLSSLSPLVALPIAVLMRTEHFSIGKVCAVGLTLVGVVLLVTTA